MLRNSASRAMHSTTALCALLLTFVAQCRLPEAEARVPCRYVPHQSLRPDVLRGDARSPDPKEQRQGTPEIDNQNVRLDGPADRSDLKPLVLSLPFGGELRPMGTVTLSKASGTGQVRVFRDDGADGEVILGPESAEPSRDLWNDLQGGWLCLLVEGCQPGVVDLALTYSFGDTTSTDQVRISVVDIQVPDSIYQLELLTHEWDLGLPPGDAPAVRDRLVYKVVSGGSALIMLDPASTDLTPAAPLSIDSQGRPCYPFGTGFRAFGTAVDTRDVDLAIYVTGEGGELKLRETVLRAPPLIMTQRVDPRTDDSEVAFEHPYGLLGHTGAWQARLAENPGASGRNIDFTRAGLTWSHEALGQQNAVIVRNGGEAANSGTDSNGGNALNGNKAAVKVYGYRPGLSLLRVHLNLGNNSILAGEWEVQCHYPKLKIPHPSQVEEEIALARSGNSELEPEFTYLDGMRHWSVPNRAGESHPVSENIRVLNAISRRQRFVVGQLIDPEEGLDDAIDDPVSDREKVFHWKSDPAIALTRAQIESIFNTYLDVTGPVFFDTMKLRLVQRLRQYNRMEQQGRPSEEAVENQDLYTPLIHKARQDIDSAALALLKMGVSIKYDPHLYVDFVSYPGTLGIGTPQAPGQNMLKAEWSSPTWLSFLYTPDTRLRDVFVNAGAGDWHLNHPYTKLILKYMIGERMDLIRSAAFLANAGWEDPGDTADPDNFMAIKLYVTGGYGGDQWYKVRVRSDLSWYSIRTTYGTGWVEVKGDSVLNPHEVWRKSHNNPSWVRIGEYMGAWNPSVIRLRDIDMEWFTENDSNREQSVLYRAIKEMWSLQEMLGTLNQYSPYQEWRDAIGGVGVWTLWTGRWFGLDNMYNASVGNDIWTDAELRTSQRLICAMLASMDVVDIAVPLGVGLTRIVGGGARHLAKRFSAGEVVEQIVSQIDDDLVRQQVRGLATEAAEFAGEAVAKNLDEVVEAGLTRVDDVIEKEIAEDASGRLMDMDIMYQHAGSNSPIAGKALKNQAIDTGPSLASAVSRANALDDMTKWRQRLYKELRKPPHNLSREVARKVFDNACFVAGTLVRMADGTSKPIEQIRKGERILSRHESGESALVASQVGETYVRRVDSVRILMLKRTKPLVRPRASRSNRSSVATSDEDGDPDSGDGSDGGAMTIRTTDEHPFWVVGRGWTGAASLPPRCRLQLSTGEMVQLESSASERRDGGVLVHNFEVPETHTYFVGDWGVWAHNAYACKGCRGFEEYWKFLRLSGQDVDEAIALKLYAQDSNGLLALTRENIRENLIRYTNSLPTIQADAHHIFPHTFKEQFARLGILVDHPRYATWWENVAHNANVHQYEDIWEALLGTVPASLDDATRASFRQQAEDLGRRVAHYYGLQVHY